MDGGAFRMKDLTRLFLLPLFALSILVVLPAPAVKGAMLNLADYLNSKGVINIKELDLQSKYYVTSRCSALYLSFSKIYSKGGSEMTPFSKIAGNLMTFAALLDGKLNPTRQSNDSMSEAGKLIREMYGSYTNIGKKNYVDTGNYTEGDNIFKIDGRICRFLIQ
jgi:hypothetical protein